METEKQCKEVIGKRFLILEKRIRTLETRGLKSDE